MNRRELLSGALLAAQRSGADDRSLVEERERQFAATLARRDFQAFQTFLSPEAIFIGDGDKPAAARGRRAVSERWRRFFDAPAPPFSWAPDMVEVLESGTLALSSGVVKNAQGAPVGRFNSVWRRESDGRWLVVFDRGCCLCAAG